MLRIALFLTTVGTAAASAGQGCQAEGAAATVCDGVAANCSPLSCAAASGTWISGANPAATACSDATDCDDAAMATGVAAGNAITAAAKAFSDADSDLVTEACAQDPADGAATCAAAATFTAGTTVQNAAAAGCDATGCVYTPYVSAALFGCRP